MPRKYKPRNEDVLNKRQKKQTDTSESVLTCHEIYNVQKLLWICKYKKNEMDEVTLKRYAEILVDMNCSEESWPYGSAQVDYVYGPLKSGRLIPKQFGYILMSKKVRHTIADNLYADLDFVNCHPRIFMYLLKDIQSSTHKEVLQSYLDNREQHLNDCVSQNASSSKDDAKQWFLMILNGGEGNPYLIQTDFMKQYKEAITLLCTQFLTSAQSSEKYDEYKKYLIARDGKNINNLNAKILSCYLMDVENKMRQALVQFLNDEGCDASVQCYDGVMSLLQDNSKNVFDLDINSMSSYILAHTGVQCTLKIKPLVELAYEIDEVSLNSIKYENLLQTKRDSSQDYESVKARFERSNFFCLQTVLYYYEEVDFVMSYSKTDFVSKWEHLQFNSIDAKGLPIQLQFIHEWIKDPYKRAYPLVGLYPPGYESHNINTSDPNHPRYAYSIWKGLRVQHIVPDNLDHKDDIEVFRNHTLYLCGGSDEFRTYLEKCIKSIFLFPGRKTDVALAFKAVQGGEGKNTWWEFVAEMIGRQYCYHSSNHDRDWFGDFNEGIRNKIWVHMEEISKNVLTKHQKQFLAYITSKEDVINLKGGKKTVSPSYCNYFLTFNSQGIDMFPGLNRRLWIHEMSNHAIKPREYYNKLYDVMKNPQCLRAIYDWFMENVDITNFNAGDESTRPFTPYMNKLWGRANAPKDKLEQWCYDKILELWSHHLNPNSYRIRLLELYESFKTSVSEKQFTPSIQTFSQRVQELFESVCSVTTSKGVKWFKFDLDECMQTFVNKQWITWEDLGYKEEYDTLCYVCVRPCKKNCTVRESKNWSDETRAVQHYNRQREKFLQYTCSCNGCFEISSKL